MKKSSFVTMLLGTVSGMLFALGMCMALIPEWDAFKPGIVFGCVGLVLALITLLVWRKMEHKEPIHISGKTIFIDGTKIESAANKYTFVWKRAITKNQARLYTKLTSFVAECEELYGIRTVYHDQISIHTLKRLKK